MAICRDSRLAGKHAVLRQQNFCRRDSRAAGLRVRGTASVLWEKGRTATSALVKFVQQRRTLNAINCPTGDRHRSNYVDNTCNGRRRHTKRPFLCRQHDLSGSQPSHFTFPVAASLLCNSLPSDIQSSPSLPVFR